VEAALVASILKAAQRGSWQAAAWVLARQHPERWGNLFADLRDFTAFSERAEPEEVLAVLSEFREAAGECVHRPPAPCGRRSGSTPRAGAGAATSWGSA
jgi:class 3 adenylate cyclase